MKQCREHNCPLQDICRGAVDNKTWWNIGEDCEIFSFVKAQDDKIFSLENRLKECENGYEGTLHLESCKLHDAEEKVKELTAENEKLTINMNAYGLTAKRLGEENERLREKLEAKINANFSLSVLRSVKADTVKKFAKRLRGEVSDQPQFGKFAIEIPFAIFERTIDQIAKEMLEGE